ncbi:MAG: hypothetical protein COA99_15065 [Moraxellaceae bacterium]|nr:MAG: hypothetical protein COA99_15065 [Moraxellaceae bacterium]
MHPINITIKETIGTPRFFEPVTLGVPFTKGIVRNIDQLIIKDSKGLTLISNIKAVTYWADNSIRWGLIDFPVDIEAYQDKIYTIEYVNTSTSHFNEATTHLTHTTEQKEDILIDTGITSFSIHKEKLYPLSQVNAKKQTLFSKGEFSLTLVDDKQDTYQPHITTTFVRYPNQSFKQEVVQYGTFINSTDSTFCDFESTLTFYAQSSHVRWDFCIHNPKAAKHNGGLWDLGDDGSVNFSSLTLSIGIQKDATTQIQIANGKEWQEATGNTSIYQGGSGGKNWKSNNHINKFGKNPVAQKGYTLLTGDKTHDGDRADPIVQSASGVSVYLKNFWQNFPKAFSSNNDTLLVELFPQRFGDIFELQGGERKTHTTYFDFSDDKSALNWARQPLTPQLSPDYYAKTGTFNHLSLNTEPCDSIIQEGLSEEHGFVAKRDSIDEYGWRNFGDIVADHESLYLDKGEIFVSHYNNQYDPLYGLIRQYVLTGNKEWMEQANDLAQHITDIDIYNTTEDRAEYNGGLFWHTDHYVDAFTSSHRTYSHKQIIEGAPTEGGGPGAEHCYTHGLSLHYFLTGNEHSKLAVLQLTQWITFFYEGTGSLLEQLLTFKNKTLAQIKDASPGNCIPTHKYPLDRGVGNYVCALLDSFSITDHREYLTKAEKVIQGTVHPNDNIADRDLENIEETWFYTIFLQAVIRYLTVKEQLDETQDANYHYAASALLHYASWIRDNEILSLDNPEKLDYPNETWTAQEIRKANILFYVSSICPSSERAKYLERAEYFYNSTVTQLQQSNTRHFSRILAILMQNHGPISYYNNKQNPIQIPENFAKNLPLPYINRQQLIKNTLFELGKKLLSFSLKAELSWLQHRSSAAKKLHDKIKITNRQT